MQDTVLVQVPAFADTLRAVFDSLAVRLSEPVQVVAPPDGWLAPANLIAEAALIVTAALTWFIYGLQRAQNQMVDRHERERRELDRVMEDQEIEAIGKRVGIMAFKLWRQLRSWLEESVNTDEGWLVGHLFEEMRAGRPVDEHALMEWAKTRLDKTHLGVAEARMDAIMTEALGAISEVARVAADAFAYFYQAARDLNEGFSRIFYEEFEDTEARRMVVNGHDALVGCVEQLKLLVPPSLQKSYIYERLEDSASLVDNAEVQDTLVAEPEPRETPATGPSSDTKGDP